MISWWWLIPVFAVGAVVGVGLFVYVLVQGWGGG